jgi:hypothetical protein
VKTIMRTISDFISVQSLLKSLSHLRERDQHMLKIVSGRIKRELSSNL